MLATAPVAAQINRPTSVLTPKGEATRHLYRFINALRDLDADQRTDVLAVLRDEILALPITA